MSTSKEQILEYIRKNIYSEEKSKGVETKKIAQSLSMQRTYVSALLNELVRDGLVEKTNTRPVLYTLSEENQNDKANKVFENLIGYNTSLKNQIQLAKAAILYSKKSLNVMLTGNPGSGISTFVKTMHQFAIESGILKKAAPFIKVNCKVYSEDISELDDIIFGDHNRDSSCFEKARGGMLFIDGFDLLNANQQSRLLLFLETNEMKYDNKEDVDYSDVYLVISVVNRPSNILTNKVPVKIELPDLKDWTFESKLELINRSFIFEAQSSQRNIKVSREVIKALLLTEFSSNIKELNNDIVKACASAYIRVLDDVEKEVYVYIDDFDFIVKRSLLLEKNNRNALKFLGTLKEYIIYDKDFERADITTETIYEGLNKQFNNLVERGVDKISLKEIMTNYIWTFFKKYNYDSINEDIHFQRLSKIIDSRIIPLVKTFIITYEKKKNRQLSSTIFYGLCFHINSLLEGNVSDRRVDNDQIVEIIQNYPDEYILSTQFSVILQKELELTIEIEEIVILVLFLIEPEESKNESRPVLLYILHGNGTATSLAEVTNAMTQATITYGYDLMLEKSPNEALTEIQTLITEIDTGSGVIVIYDMGSISTILDTIIEETGMKIRYLNIPITLTGISTARKCMVEENIDTVFHSISMEMNQYQRKSDNNKVIITLCHTGEGGAVQLKNYIDNYSHLGIKTIPLAISDRNKLYDEVSNIRKVYNIHAFVGTYDPKLLGIPFISIKHIFESETTNLDHILLFEPINVVNADYELIYKNFEEQFVYTPIVKLKNVLPSVVDELSLIYNLDSDRTIGLFVHLACSIERILSGEDIAQMAIPEEKMMTTYIEDYRIIVKALKKIEKTFKIIINDKEISTIVLMVNQY